MPDNSSLLLDIADVLLFISSLAVWAIVFWRWRTSRTIVPYEPRRPVPWLGVDLALVILAFLVAGAIMQHFAPEPHGTTSSGPAADSSTVVKPANPPKGQTERDAANSKTVSAADLAVNMIAELAMAGMAIGWVVFRVRATPSDLGLTLSRIGPDVVLGGATFFAAILPVGQIQKYLVENVTPYDHPLIKAVKHQPDAWMLSVVAISAIIVAPFAEELFFRVLMQGCFEAVEAKRRWLLTVKRSLSGLDPSPQAHGTSVTQPRPIPTVPELAALSRPAAWPIVVTSIVFALMHAGQGAAPIPLFIFSLFLGYVYQRTHRIWPSLVTHMLLNGSSMATLWYVLMNPVK
jgi:membrane protease YdiL (CAAX protease family)